MVDIVTYTGEGGKAKWSAKAYVFIHDPETRQEPYIYYAAKLIDEDPWIEKWRKQQYEVPEGTIIKLSGGNLKFNIPFIYGCAYFVVRSDLPIVKVTCGDSQHTQGYIIGPLEKIPYGHIEDRLDIKIKAEYKKYYRSSSIIVQPTEEPVQLHEKGEC